MSMNYYLPVRFYSGKGVINKHSKDIKELGNSCLIVTGKHSAKACGAYDDVVNVLKKENITYYLYDGITQNPKFDECQEAADIAKEKNVDFIIGIGGGSPLDASKCISVLSTNDLDQKGLYSMNWENKPIPVVAIGTTAGTGSEVTKVSVITTQEGLKKSFKDDSIYPVLSFGDPTYLQSLSDYFIRSTAIDALSHSVESYFNTEADDISRGFALKSIQLLLPIFRLLKDADTSILRDTHRETLYNASILGGMAINTTGTALPHAVGYLLTEDYNIPHGIACAVFLPAFFYINEIADKELTQTFLNDLHITKREYLELIDAMIPEYEVMMSEEDIQKNHSRWINNGSINKCLAPVDADTVDDILRELFVK